MVLLDERVVGVLGVADVLERLDQVRVLAGQALVDERLEELAERAAGTLEDDQRVPVRLLLHPGHRLGAERTGGLDQQHLRVRGSHRRELVVEVRFRRLVRRVRDDLDRRIGRLWEEVDLRVGDALRRIPVQKHLLKELVAGLTH